MKYYEEAKMGELRLAFEKRAMRWPHVSTKRMFGCPCYEANGRLFAFMVTDGVVLTQLPESDKDELSKRDGVDFFRPGRRVSKWLRIPVKSEGELEETLTFVRKSYLTALHKHLVPFPLHGHLPTPQG